MLRKIASALLLSFASCTAPIFWDDEPDVSAVDGGHSELDAGADDAGARDAGTPTYAPSPPLYECDATQGPTISPPMRRLSRRQWDTTVDTLVHDLAGPDAMSILNGVATTRASMPPDAFVSKVNKGRDGFQRADQLLTQQHAVAQYDLAVELGKALTQTPALRARLFGACATDTDTSNDVTCVDAFVRQWGPRILRRAVVTADVDFYRRALRGTVASQEALADVVALLFASPGAFFLVEEGSAVPADAQLNAHELAARLSYQLLDAPPDSELLAAASSGALMTDAGYVTQVDRLLADPRAKATLHDFFNGWFQLHRVPDMSAGLGAANYRTLVGTFPVSAQLTQGVVDDVFGSVDHVIDTNAPAAALLTDKAVYTRDSNVAALYGLSAAWDGGGAPPEPPSTERAGLLTRVALLATGDVSSHPVLRGVRLRTELLCDVLGEVPANAADTAAMTVLTGMETERERTTIQTERLAGCAGCHRTSINPLGFPFERFDSLGRERVVEKVINAAGTVVAERPVETSSIARVTFDDPRAVANAVELTDRVVNSKKFETCLATQYFRFTFAKVTETPRDGCFLAGMEATLRDGASLKQMIRATVLSPDFKRRVVEAP